MTTRPSPLTLTLPRRGEGTGDDLQEACRAHSTIITPFITIQCPGKVQRYG